MTGESSLTSLLEKHEKVCRERDLMAERYAKNPCYMTYLELGKAWDRVYEVEEALKEKK